MSISTMWTVSLAAILSSASSGLSELFLAHKQTVVSHCLDQQAMQFLWVIPKYRLKMLCTNNTYEL